MNSAHIKFEAEVGALLRRQFRREMQSIAFNHDLELECQEAKGLITSTFFVKFKGPDKTIKFLEEPMRKWLKEAQR